MLAAVFPDCGKVFGIAATVLLGAMTDKGRPLVQNLAEKRRDGRIALDGGDISKEFGGRGMEGMEMGHDGSRGVVAMGHNLLGAAVVNASRARALCLKLLKGRQGLPRAAQQMLS